MDSFDSDSDDNLVLYRESNSIHYWFFCFYHGTAYIHALNIEILMKGNLFQMIKYGVFKTWIFMSKKDLKRNHLIKLFFLLGHLPLINARHRLTHLGLSKLAIILEITGQLMSRVNLNPFFNFNGFSHLFFYPIYKSMILFLSKELAFMMRSTFWFP